MGAEEHGLTIVLRFADEVEELMLHQWIEAAGGLIENQQLGLVHEGLDQSEFLTISLRQIAYGPVEVEIQALGERFHRAGCDGAADALEMIQHRLPAAPFRQLDLSREIPDAPAQLGFGLLRCSAENGDCAVGGADDVDEHAQRRGLAGAVGADQTINGSAFDGEVYTADGVNITEPLVQSSCFDQCFHRALLRLGRLMRRGGGYPSNRPQGLGEVAARTGSSGSSVY